MEQLADRSATKTLCCNSWERSRPVPSGEPRPDHCGVDRGRRAVPLRRRKGLKLGPMLDVDADAATGQIVTTTQLGDRRRYRLGQGPFGSLRNGGRHDQGLLAGRARQNQVATAPAVCGTPSRAASLSTDPFTLWPSHYLVGRGESRWPHKRQAYRLPLSVLPWGAGQAPGCYSTAGATQMSTTVD
jgi:hypothetical protein